MAEGLARSMRFHNPEVNLALVTDCTDPGLSILFDQIVKLDERLGTGVSQKLHVDRYSPFDETIFIDSDCLAFDDPELLWDMYRDAKGFGVKGWAYLGPSDAHYAVADTGKLLTACGIERLGAFNSGLFFFDRTPLANRIFETARELASRSRELGLAAFKNSPFADEPIFALALELNQTSMLPWDQGAAMCTASADDLTGLDSINVFAGQRRLIRYKTVTEPVILHFHLHAQDSFPYIRELHRLKLGTRLGRGFLPALRSLPAFAGVYLRYLRVRLQQRFNEHGVIGLLPERLELAWKKQSRSDSEN